MRELSLQLILETAGFKYEETTALMHKTGFFQDKVDDPLSSSLELLIDPNVKAFEKKERFGDPNTNLPDLVNKLSDYINGWIKEKSITTEQLFNCVMANYFTAADVISASKESTRCLLTLREKFNGNLDKFVREITKQSELQRN